MHRYQPAQLAALISLISSTKGSVICSNVLLSNPSLLTSLIAVYICRARTASWYAKTSTCPPDLQVLVGVLRLSAGHSRRMCRLLCSEWWHQVRFLKDCLRVTCQQDLSPPQVNYKYNLWLKLCNQVTEWLWNQVRPTLPARTRTKATSEAKVLNLSECDVPVKHLDVLSKGPKFCVEPALRPAELVSVSRSVARRVPEDSRTTCVAECTDVLLKHRPRRVHDIVMSSVVDFLHSSGLTCVVSDKEGFFVVLTRGLFSEKGSVAIAKNFREVSHNPSKIKKQAVELLKSLSLDKLVNKVKKEMGDTLDVFFTAKTHKPDIPFRTIVSERNTWLQIVSRYLQKNLESLVVADPFQVASSDILVDFLRNNDSGGLRAFSLDIEDLYYSLPQAPLLQSVKECIGNQEDEFEFTSRSGVSVEGFLEVLRCYLEATLVTWNGKVFAQKSGVCIGSCVAPILSTIFLAKVDRAIQGSLVDLAIKVFRYVDDYLVFVDRCVFIRKMIDVMKVFREQGHGLTFTCEVPRNDALQYLDLQLAFSPDGLCWRYKPRSQKGLLDYQSGHSRLVKNGIASSCIRSAISKSCPHLIRQSMCEQAVKLRQAGYPDAVIAAVSERLLKTIRAGGKLAATERCKGSRPFSVIPYIHGVSHRFKRVAARFGVNVVFSAKSKLKDICPRLQHRENKKSGKKGKCTMRHGIRFVSCVKGVVYETPFSCGHVYVGQSGRCLNIRLREHHSSLKGTPTSHLALHCRQCGCTPMFDQTAVLFRHREQLTRELVEACFIRKRGEKCVSHPSVLLHDKEFSFLMSTFS
uniref:Putative tick transposon ovary overexpressed n=1 Tax=Rhipicephalus microplus TaxID=6941 RepID=A0A6M2CYP7_RHIMP